MLRNQQNNWITSRQWGLNSDDEVSFLNESNHYGDETTKGSVSSGSRKAKSLIHESSTAYAGARESDILHKHACGCKDGLFALLFIAYTVATVSFAALFGDDVMSNVFEQNAVELIKGSIIMICVAFLPTFLWSLILAFCSRIFFNVALLLMSAGSFAAAVFGTMDFQQRGFEIWWWPGAVFGLIGVLPIILLVLFQETIRFSSMMLNVGIRATLRQPVIYLISMIMTFLALGYFLISIYTTIGIIYYFELSDFKQISALVLIMTFALFWSINTIEGILQITTSNNVARWWIGDVHSRSTWRDTVHAFCRATTVFLGSASLGALFISLIETLQLIFRILIAPTRLRKNCCFQLLFSCVNSIITCLDYLVSFFNRLVYAYVGIYGFSYCKAGRAVWRLLNNSGCKAVANDLIVETVLWIGSLLASLICAFVGYEIGRGRDAVLVFHRIGDTGPKEMRPELFLAAIGLGLGYFASRIYFSVASAAVSTVFLKWVEDPSSLKASHYDYYSMLREKWKKQYPTETKNLMS